MSNFANNTRASAAFYGGQDAHYGIKSGEAHLVTSSNPTSTQSRGRAPQRKPVTPGKPQSQQTAAPKSAVPARKPVDSERTKSSATANRSGAPNLNKALPRTPLPFIGRDSSGRFDPKTTTINGNPPQSPIGRSAPAPVVPEQAQALLQSPAGSAPPTPGPTASRPTSSDGWSLKARKRADSGASGYFSRSGSPSGSRRSSITEAAKNALKSARDKAEILAMSKAERENFTRGHKKVHDREVELARQQSPSTRPQHQKEYLVRKQQGAKPGESWGLAPVDASYEAQMQERAFRERVSSGHKKIHNENVKLAALKGKPRPITPEAAKLSPPAGSLNEEERADARVNSNASSADELAGFDAAERFALNLSQKLDAFKFGGRKDSDCSDMDFGMTDTAPAGAMDLCGEVPGPNFGKGCHMPATSALKAGLCEQCYAYAKHADHDETTARPRIKGHNPISPEEDANRNDLYIHLPGQHKLRKVRETMYDDPGNPWAVEDIELPLLPSTTYGSVEFEKGDDDIPWHQWQMEQNDEAHNWNRTDNGIPSMLSDPFDLVNTHTSVLSNRETLSSSQSNRRSMSVDIIMGSMPDRVTLEQQDYSNFGYTHPPNIRSLHIQRPSGSISTMDSRRDSQFYDFYDSILAEYGIHTKESINKTRKALLSVSY